MVRDQNEPQIKETVNLNCLRQHSLFSIKGSGSLQPWFPTHTQVLYTAHALMLAAPTSRFSSETTVSAVVSLLRTQTSALLLKKMAQL